MNASSDSAPASVSRTSGARLRYDVPGDRRGTIVRNLRDLGTVVVAEVTWEPGGTSGCTPTRAR